MYHIDEIVKPIKACVNEAICKIETGATRGLSV